MIFAPRYIEFPGRENLLVREPSIIEMEEIAKIANDGDGENEKKAFDLVRRFLNWKDEKGELNSCSEWTDDDVKQNISYQVITEMASLIIPRSGAVPND